MQNLLPDWAPNVHPMLVHFPIAIIILAVFLDFVYLIWKKDWLRNSVMTLFAFAVLASLVTYLSGRQAVDSVSVPMNAELTASYHADWALYTLLYFSSYTAIRAFLSWKKIEGKRFITILLFLAGLAGCALLAKTADLGGKLVYKYGVGTQKAK
ncbi:MAG: DUF2231 domain-containing protein [Bacteroidota bacterium]